MTESDSAIAAIGADHSLPPQKQVADAEIYLATNGMNMDRKMADLNRK